MKELEVRAAPEASCGTLSREGLSYKVTDATRNCHKTWRQEAQRSTIETAGTSHDVVESYRV